MRSRSCETALVLAAAAGLIGACGSPRTTVGSTEPIRHPSTHLLDAPMPDLSRLRTLHGERPDLRGRVTVLELGTTNCAGCAKLAPALEKLAHDAGGKVQVVQVVDGRAEDDASILRHVAATLPPGPVLVDDTGALFDECGVKEYPAVFVVDAEGRVVWWQSTARAELVEEWVTDTAARMRR